MSVPTMNVTSNSIIPVFEKQLLVRAAQDWRPFSYSDWEQLEIEISYSQTLICIEGSEHTLVVIKEEPRHTGFELVGLRDQLQTLDSYHTSLAGKALQYAFWRDNHRFCGNCGSPTVSHATEIALECPNCEAIYYPRLNPCVMVLITRGDHCLLAHNAAFREGMYSAIAGYIEPGEAIEQTLHREVIEEVNLKVKNIQYFGSQPWPFPSQLMIAYTAEYGSGEIQVDGVEITDAQWFHYSELPKTPSIESISGKLIRAFVEKFETHSQH
ncbi:NAD(+) diphosphatase [Puniceicoccaceae bacterium K14]|nr:NAD(+) diphosphatase [Puniceicoccaceae bacterium K14]